MKSKRRREKEWKIKKGVKLKNKYWEKKSKKTPKKTGKWEKKKRKKIQEIIARGKKGPRNKRWSR